MSGWNDEDYRRAFADGHARNRHVAGIIGGWGVWVECPDLSFARSFDEIAEFTRNEKDIITRAGIIEVKGQRRLFTADVSEFPYATQIVDTVESWEGKSEKPIAYVMVCMQNLECVVISTKSQPRWRVERRFDRFKQRQFEFYVADRSCILSMDVLKNHLVKVDSSWKEQNPGY